MSTEDVALILKFALVAWLSILFALVAVKILRGDINTDGLLSSPQGELIDPERLVLVAITVAAAGYYLLNTLGTPIEELCNAAGKDCFMPDIPAELLVLLGGSQTAYLSGKILRNNGMERE